MLLALTLAVSLAAPPSVDLTRDPTGSPTQPDLRVAPPPNALRLDLAGSGDGEPHHHGDGDHMSAMWIVMGAMMAVMMVGAGVYMMRGSTHSAPLVAGSPTLSGPAAAALPPSASPGG